MCDQVGAHDRSNPLVRLLHCNRISGTSSKNRQYPTLIESSSMSDNATPGRQRPQFRNINALSDLPSYRLPAAGWVSILHRVSGVLMFLLMPFIIWMFDTSISSEISFERFTGAFSVGMLGLPGFIWKLLALGLIWAYLHHFCAGLRHLRMDMNHSAVDKRSGASSARIVLMVSLALTAVLGAKLFGLY